MMISRILCALIAGLALCVHVNAQSIVLNEDETRLVEDFNWIPYGFFSESFGLGLGVGAGYVGWPQEQASVIGTVTAGTEGSYTAMAGLNEWIVPGTSRLMLEPIFAVGRYHNQRLYVGRQDAFGGERAGSNDSDADHYLEVTQWDNWVDMEFSYLLPWGHGRDTIISKYHLKEGLLHRGASGGGPWNPLRSGRTYVSVTPAWREQTEDLDGISIPFETLNMELALEYDNYDFPFNPSAGSHQRLSFKQDFQDDTDLGDWQTWEFAADKIFNLHAGKHTLQRVLALGFWTAYVPTWETGLVDGKERVTKRPPHYEGATLGGIYRMRAFETDRFQDRASIYYSAEYRFIPRWQPLCDQGWLSWADISWWQWTFFAEAGQVAPEYTVSDLHDALHVDGGVSMRGMVHEAVLRLDFAFGEEGGRIVAMYGHPF